MEVIRELRPVEALYLLDHAKEENITEEKSLVAVVVYLTNEGYIQPRPPKTLQKLDVRLTDRGSMEFSSLRPYEREGLTAIAKDDPKGLLEAVETFDFDGLLVKMGFMTEEKTRKGIWPFKWTKTGYVPTHKYHQALKELEELRDELVATLTDGSEDPYLISMSYAFPSEGFTQLFRDHTSGVIDTAIIAMLTGIAARDVPTSSGDKLTTS